MKRDRAHLFSLGVLTVSLLYFAPAAQGQQKHAGGGSVWGSFGAMSGKQSPVAPPAAKNPAKQITTRADKLQLWNLGTYIAAAALSNQNANIPQTNVDQFYSWAAEIAKKFQLPFSPLPARKDTMSNLAWALKGNYPLWLSLEERYGETEKTVVEISTKVGLLRLIYEENGHKSEFADQISQKIKDDGVLAFPERIWKPLTDAIDRGASKDEINKRIDALDAAVQGWYDPSKPAPRN
jgi:hypothetical protein